MPPLVNLQTPTLSYVDSENKQQLVSDDSVVQIVSSKDAEFGGVAVSTLRSDADTVLDRTQKISSDGTSTFITGDLVCDSDIKLSGNLFNVDAEVSVSDHVEINSDGGSVPALKVTNVNNQAPPLLIQHGGSDILSLAIDGTLTNSNIQQIESDVSSNTAAIDQEVIDRQTAISSLSSSTTSSINALQGRATTLESEMDAVEGRATTLESEMDAVEGRATTLETKTQNLTSTSDESTFSVSSKVKWDTGDEYFAIKSRASVSVSASTTVDVPLDFKSHVYSVGSNQDGCYDVTLMHSGGDSSSPFFRGTLVKYSTGTSVLYTVASYQCSVSYTQSTSTLGFTFDSAQTKDFTLTWNLVN